MNGKNNDNEPSVVDRRGDTRFSPQEVEVLKNVARAGLVVKGIVLILATLLGLVTAVLSILDHVRK
jgi:hypothetical protein